MAAPRNLKVKAAVAAVICHPAVGRLLGWAFRDDIPVPSRGMRFWTSGSVAPASKAQLFWGIYESAEDRFVRRYLRDDLDVVELGSGIGAVSSRIARILRGGRRLTCVEANRELLPLLRANVARNAPGARVEFVHAALGEADGDLADLVVGAAHETARVGSAAEAKRLAVPTVTLHGVLTSRALTEFALVCDVEGAEAALIGSAGALAGCRQLVIELHDTVHGGERWSVEDLREALVSRHGMRLVDRYGPVCVFERAGERRP